MQSCFLCSPPQNPSRILNTSSHISQDSFQQWKGNQIINSKLSDCTIPLHRTEIVRDSKQIWVIHTRAKKVSTCSLFQVLQNTVTEKAVNVGISRTIILQLLQIIYFATTGQCTHLSRNRSGKISNNNSKWCVSPQEPQKHIFGFDNSALSFIPGETRNWPFRQATLYKQFPVTWGVTHFQSKFSVTF